MSHSPLFQHWAERELDHRVFFSGGCMLGSEGWLARFLAFVIAAVVPISQSVYSLWPQQM